MQILIFLSILIGVKTVQVREEFNCFYAARVCPNFYYDPICAYDDKKQAYETFDNLCNLHDFNCEKKTSFVVQYAGPCVKEKNTKVTFAPRPAQPAQSSAPLDSPQSSKTSDYTYSSSDPVPSLVEVYPHLYPGYLA